MADNIKQWVQLCDVCFRSKSPAHSTDKMLLKPIPVEGPWNLVGIDCTMLPMMVSGKY